jgi:autotransporter-associated beta strand protein
LWWEPTEGSNWGNPNNWFDPDHGGNFVPQNGDDLHFGDLAVLTGPDDMMNDLTDLAVNSMSFDIIESPVVRNWVLNGNTLIISNTTAPPYGIYAIDNTTGDDSYVHINCGLKLATAATFATGGIAINGAGTSVQMAINGPIDLNGHTLTLLARTADYSGTGQGDSVGVLYIGAPISGNGNVNLSSGKGSLIDFNGSSASSFHGTMTANAGLGGTIFFYCSGVVVNDSLVVNDVGTVQLAKSDQIGDSATVTIMAGAALSLYLGSSDTIGSLMVVNVSADAQPSIMDTGTGTLTVNGDIIATCNNDNHTPTIKGQLSLASGSHNITTTGSAYAGLDMQAQVTGFGNFHKLGNSALLLEANNTFSGSISVDAGILDVRNNNGLGDVAGDTSLSGGSLTLRNVAIGTERLTAEDVSIAGEMPGSLLTSIGSNSWAGQVLLDTNLVVFGGDMSFAGDISGAGGIGFFNTGTSVLGGLLGNLYTGTTLVRCPLLEFNKPSGVNAYAGPLVVGGGGGGPYEARWLNAYQNVGANLTLYANGLVNLNNQNEDFGPVTFNGGEVDTGSGQFAFYQPLTVNPSTAIAVINGNLGLPPGNVYFNVGDGAADPDILVNAVVLGDGSPVVKQGSGTMRLTAANTFTGAAIISEGVLEAYNAVALGVALAHTIVQSNATLRLGFSGTMTESLFLSGSGVGGTAGAVEVVGGNFLSLTSVTLDNPSTFNVDLGCGLTINGAIFGTGPLTKMGAGFMQFTGAGANAYSGDTLVKAGALNVAKNPNVIAVPHNLVIGPAFASSPAVAHLYQTGGLGGTNVSVNANSLFDLNGYYQALATLNLRDGGNVQTGVGLLDFPSGGAINVGSVNAFGSHVSSAITGTIGLPPNASLIFNINPFAPFFPFASGPELDLLAAIPRPVENVSFAPAGITKNGDGQMRLSANNTYAGSSIINDGTLSVDGTQPQSQVVVNSGTLAGAGTVGHIYMTGSGAVVAPGDAGPGILTCSNLNAGITASGVLRMELNGTTAGSGYDQLNVRGTVNLAGVALQPLLGFTAPTGAQFDLISNDGSDAVTGTFNGLADGGKLYVGGVLYQINYRFSGKPGNDVALQGLDTPPPPILRIERVSPLSVRLIWPTNDPPFSLQTATNLALSSWTNALPLPVVLGTNNIVTNPVANAQQFYRLSNP